MSRLTDGLIMTVSVDWVVKLPTNLQKHTLWYKVLARKKKNLDEVLLRSTHNIMFSWRNKKNIFPDSRFSALYIRKLVLIIRTIYLMSLFI